MAGGTPDRAHRLHTTGTGASCSAVPSSADCPVHFPLSNASYRLYCFMSSNGPDKWTNGPALTANRGSHRSKSRFLSSTSPSLVSR